VSEQASEPAEVPVDQTAETVEPERAASLGLLLRKAREARGLAVADVVAALKYSPRQIEALEADQMELLPGSVFMRGIVRSYARLVKLDPVPLLALLDAEDAATMPDVRPPEDMGIAMPRTRARQISGVTAAVIVIGVVAVAAGAWHLLAPAPQAVPASAQQAAAVEAPAPTPAALPEPSVAAPTPELPTAVVQPSLVGHDSAVAAATALVAPAEPAAVPTPPAAVPPAAAGKQLVFDFHGASWVEVKDASQRVIFTGQYGNGMRQAAAGRPPFQIIIGNAPTVELKYEGRSIDLKPYTRADVARLSLE